MSRAKAPRRKDAKKSHDIKRCAQEGQKLKIRCLAQRRRGAKKGEIKDIIKGAARRKGNS